MSDPGAGNHTQVIAFGRNGVSTTAPLPPFRVKPCKAPHKLLLTYRMMPNRSGEIEVTAALVAHGASQPFQPVRFVWTFGDGTTTETSAPVEVHDYSRRPQKSLTSTFVVGCTAYSQAGEKVEGRVGLTAESQAIRFDTHQERDVYGIEYYVEGVTDDGWPASGNFAIMQPPRPPTPENHTPVIDPVLEAKILRARELLGKPYVTDEDIWRLEREGLMTDLQIEPADPPRVPPPARPRAPSH